MHIFPQHFPPESWWCGRTYVREAERLAQTLHQHTLQPQAEKLAQRLAFENLFRGIRTLVELPPSTRGAPYFEDPRLLNNLIPDFIQPFFPSFDELRDDLDQAIKETKNFFYQYFLHSHREEFAYLTWDGDDTELLSAIFGEQQQQLSESAAQFSPSAQPGIQIIHQAKQTFCYSILANHNYYWNIEEFEDLLVDPAL